MSAEDEFDALFNAETETPADGGELVKQLRAALKKSAAENKALKAQVQEHSTATRASALKTTLEEFGAKPALAKYFPADSEVSKETVQAWLKEDGEIFGWQPPAAEQTPEATQDDAAIRAVAGLVPQVGANSVQARAASLAQTRTLGRDITSAEAQEAGAVADALLQNLGLSLR